MLKKYILPGCKLELQMVSQETELENQGERKKYESRVYDVLSDDRLEIMMPMEQTKLVLLPVDSECDIYFYADLKVLQCSARIIDRYKANNVYILVIEIISNLRKYQRREFYRLSCALEMGTRQLEEEEIEAIDTKQEYLVPGLPLKRSVIVDISGGGLRFVSSQKYEVDSLIYCHYTLMVGKETKEFNVVGKVLRAQKVENRQGGYEHRLQYINLDNVDREGIIKYIFDEERKSRNRDLK